jgi:hypothetical protein
LIDWQVTATTVYCDAVDSDVTLMVYKDGSFRCAEMRKYGDAATKDNLSALKKRAAKAGRTLACEGENCPRQTAYRDRVFAGETNT